MSLYTKDIGQIQYDEVDSFVALKLREDLRIDYKADFPRDLAKIVVAFANTAGGLILIGVSANNTTNEPERIVGVPLAAGLEERVTNVTMSNIKPPISPEVKVCPFKSDPGLAADDRAVVVIRVSQSDIAPHSDANNIIWIRSHNTCNPASLDVIEKLLEKRDEGTALREEMERDANQILANAALGFDLIEGRIRYYAIRLSPVLPFNVTFNKSTDDFLRDQVVSIGGINETSPKLNGIELASRNQTTRRLRRFFSFNRDGFFIHAATLEMPNTNDVYAERTIQILAKTMRASTNIFEHFGYFGKLSIELLLREVRGIELTSLITGIGAEFDEPRTCPDEEIKIERLYSLAEIRANERAILASFYNDLLRAFQVTLPEAALASRLDNLITHLPR